MNGEEVKFLNEKFNDLKYEVVELRTKAETRWDNHDKRSENIWKEIKENTAWLQSNIAKLPCRTHIETLNWHTKLLWTLWIVVIVAGVINGASWVAGFVK